MDDQEAQARLKRITKILMDSDPASNRDRLVEIAKIAISEGALDVGGERLETRGRNREERGGSTRRTR
jgi:hypothetical protein